MATLTRDVDLLAAHAKDVPVRSASPSLLQLHIAGNALTLKPGLTYILGSAPEAHVHIGGSDIAPQHAKIAHDQLLPMQSALPTLLNGQIVGHNIAAPLREGDVITLGAHQIRIGRAIEQDSTHIQRHEQSTVIPSAQTLQAGNVNTHLLPSKDTGALHGGVHHDMSKLSLGDGTHKLAPGAGQHATHILPVGPGVTREVQPQHLHEQRTTLGQLEPGQTRTLPDGTSVHAGSHPTIVEQVRHEQPIQQQQLYQQPQHIQQHHLMHQQPLAAAGAATTGPALARLSAHQQPQHTEQVRIAEQPMTFASSHSGITQSAAAPHASATSAAPAILAVPLPTGAAAHHTMQQQPQQLQHSQQPITTSTVTSSTTSAPLQHHSLQQQPIAATTHHSSAIPVSTHTTLDSTTPAFSHTSSLVPADAVPVGIASQQHHTASTGVAPTGIATQQQMSSLPISGSSIGGTSAAPSDSYVLAPAFSSAELSSILADMLDLSGGHMSAATRESVPHLLSLFAPAERQQMNSGHVKRWLHAAQEERAARLGQSSADAGLAARALGATSTDHKELTQADLLFAMLAMQAQQHNGSSATLHGISGNSTSAQLGAAKLAAPAPLNMSSSVDGAAGSTQSDYALLQLLSDMAEMGSWRLSSGWEAAVRYMLNEQHMPSQRRADLSSSAKLKAWLRAAAADRDRSLNGRAAEPVVGAPAGGDISPLHLARGLIQQNHAI